MRTEVQLGFPEELFDVQMYVGELTQVGTALMQTFSETKWCMSVVSRDRLILIGLQRLSHRWGPHWMRRATAPLPMALPHGLRGGGGVHDLVSQ